MTAITREYGQSFRPVETDLFTPIRLGPYELPNRIVMAPLTRNRAGPGNVPQVMTAEYYAQRASAGLIITEATQVNGHVLKDIGLNRADIGGGPAESFWRD